MKKCLQKEIKPLKNLLTIVKIAQTNVLMFSEAIKSKGVFLSTFYMSALEITYAKSVYKKSKEESLFGRWITLDHIQPLFDKYQSETIQYNQIGISERERPIYQLTLGKGEKKILIWTQMHGNESTGTKAVFDLLNYLDNNQDDISQQILSNCTIKIIPILNPDGAKDYTRSNGNKVDLNRDAVKRVAKESQLLRKHLDEFQPDFCFNMHDQRTIFGVSGTNNPATISFLAPSEEQTRRLTLGRKQTMNVIVAMNTLLQQAIPGHVGRYTDEFYPTATGDNFQKLGYNTILIESGHYPNDYEREITREYTFISLLQGLHHIASVDSFDSYKEYFEIPDNQQNFKDLVHKFENNKKNQVFQYEEVLEDRAIKFVPIRFKGDVSNLLFHKEIVFVS